MIKFSGKIKLGEKMTQDIKLDERTKTEVWTRVMGYHRPLESFNKGKKEGLLRAQIALPKKSGCTYEEILTTHLRIWG